MTNDIIEKVRELRCYGGVHHEYVEMGYFDKRKGTPIIFDLIAHVNELRDIALSALESKKLGIDAMESLKDFWQTRAEVAEHELEEMKSTCKERLQVQPTDRAAALEWLENVKGFLSRCKDTEWDESDEYILRVILSWMPVTPDVKSDRARAYQELYGLLESLDKPHTNSEMNDIINVVLKWWGK